VLWQRGGMTGRQPAHSFTDNTALPLATAPSFPVLGADRLKRQIALVARQHRATGRDSPLRPLLDATAAVAVPRGLMGAITAAIQEDGELADNASEQVGRWRGGGCFCVCVVCV
jgi:hypothetical protein